MPVRVSTSASTDDVPKSRPINSSHPCFLCGLMFAKYHDFEHHQNVFHKKVQPPIQPELFRICDQCGKLLSSKSHNAFARHRLEHDLALLLEALYDEEEYAELEESDGKLPAKADKILATTSSPSTVPCSSPTKESPPVGARLVATLEENRTAAINDQIKIENAITKAEHLAEIDVVKAAAASKKERQELKAALRKAALMESRKIVVTNEKRETEIAFREYAAKAAKQVDTPPAERAIRRKRKLPIQLDETLDNDRPEKMPRLTPMPKVKTVATPGTRRRSGRQQQASSPLPAEFTADANDSKPPLLSLSITKNNDTPQPTVRRSLLKLRSSARSAGSVADQNKSDETAEPPKPPPVVQYVAPKTAAAVAPTVLSVICPNCGQSQGKPWLLVEHMISEHGAKLVHLEQKLIPVVDADNPTPKLAVCDDFQCFFETSSCLYCDQPYNLGASFDSKELSSKRLTEMKSHVLFHVLSKHRNQLFECPTNVQECDVRFEVLSSLDEENGRKYIIRIKIKRRTPM